jgi:hypothetical protein
MQRVRQLRGAAHESRDTDRLTNRFQPSLGVIKDRVILSKGRKGRSKRGRRTANRKRHDVHSNGVLRNQKAVDLVTVV